MSFAARPNAVWQMRTRVLTLGSVTRVMGILNVTPDSFSDGSQFRAPSEAVDAALQMLADGAAIVDIGGESTRPGDYAKIATQQEVDRVLPVIEGILRARPDALLSIDTYHSETARLAVEAGVEIVNDVSGFLWEPAMAALTSQLACGVVLMHTRGQPQEWSTLPALSAAEVPGLVHRELQQRLGDAVVAGVAAERVVLDPGFGFGKRLDENFPLLAHLDQLLALGRPLLAGVSRKGFLGRDRPAQEREQATIVASTAALLIGVSILRIHNVPAGVEAANIADATLLSRKAERL